MAYDDGYYYGQCKIVAVVDNTADDGKTVLITTDDNKTYSGTIANKKCEFLLPPRTLYTVQKVSSGSAEFTTKVEAGYGDCILVHLDTGYVEVKQGDIVGLDYIKAATNDNLKNKVPEAKAVKELNSSLTANNTPFIYDYQDGKYGFNTDPNRGADTFHPFKSGTEIINLGTVSNGTRTFDLTGYDGYENFTVDNFIIAIDSLSASISFNVNTRGGAASTSTSASYTKSYNATTGTLTINGGGSSAGVSSYSGKYNSGSGSVNLTSSVTVYLVK